MLAVCWIVIELSIGNRAGNIVWKFDVTLTCTCEFGAQGAGLHATAADQFSGGCPGCPSSAVSLAVAADCTASGATTTPVRAASRAAVVKRFRVKNARLSSAPPNSTRSKKGRMRINSRVTTPRWFSTCLRMIIDSFGSPGGDPPGEPMGSLGELRRHQGADGRHPVRQQGAEGRRERRHDGASDHGAEEDPLHRHHPTLVTNLVKHSVQQHQHRSLPSG